MSDTTITPEERTLWASIATARINAVTPERQCEITAQERLVKVLKALEQAEADLSRVKAADIEAMRRAEQANARAEKAENEPAGADAEITELRDELEDSRGTEKDAPNILCAIARLVGVYEHCQGLGDDMGDMTLDAVRELLAEKQKSENARLTKMVDFMAQQIADVYSTDEYGRSVLTCPVRTLRAADHDCDKISCPQCWVEAARRAVAAGEE